MKALRARAQRSECRTPIFLMILKLASFAQEYNGSGAGEGTAPLFIFIIIYI